MLIAQQFPNLIDILSFYAGAVIICVTAIVIGITYRICCKLFLD